MFIKIEASATGEENRILFYYNRDTLFNDVSLMSSFMAKNIATKEGESLTDEYAISDDEKNLVDVCIRATLPDIFESMVKITNSVVPAFYDKVSEAGTTRGEDISGQTVAIDAGNYVEFHLRDNNAFNPNVLTMVDASLYNSLKYGVLKEFYSTVVHADFFKLCSERFVGELFKLKQRLFQLKKKSVVSSLS